MTEYIPHNSYPSSYDQGYQDALKKVLESLPNSRYTIENDTDLLNGGNEHLKDWNAYRLAAREIIKKLIKD